MSNGHSNHFNDAIIGGAAITAGGAFLQTADLPSEISSGRTAAAAKAEKPVRLGIERGDMRGLLPDLAGIAILVTALGTYGGFW